jgi:hypothetical protein
MGFFLFTFVSMDWAFTCTALVDPCFNDKRYIVFIIWNHLVEFSCWKNQDGKRNIDFWSNLHKNLKISNICWFPFKLQSIYELKSSRRIFILKNHVGKKILIFGADRCTIYMYIKCEVKYTKNYKVNNNLFYSAGKKH